jgi:hypothetical protein
MRGKETYVGTGWYSPHLVRTDYTHNLCRGLILEGILTFKAILNQSSDNHKVTLIIHSLQNFLLILIRNKLECLPLSVTVHLSTIFAGKDGAYS